mmetsp:Transcript_16430/g.45546  ORF Transcript_16430/g.45546 Transcript_16430/m.45546 type:complete len:147 (+) Transcript_16430:638-1078(+)
MAIGAAKAQRSRLDLSNIIVQLFMHVEDSYEAQQHCLCDGGADVIVSSKTSLHEYDFALYEGRETAVSWQHWCIGIILLLLPLLLSSSSSLAGCCRTRRRKAGACAGTALCHASKYEFSTPFRMHDAATRHNRKATHCITTHQCTR